MPYPGSASFTSLVAYALCFNKKWLSREYVNKRINLQDQIIRLNVFLNKSLEYLIIKWIKFNLCKTETDFIPKTLFSQLFHSCIPFFDVLLPHMDANCLILTILILLQTLWLRFDSNTSIYTSMPELIVLGFHELDRLFTLCVLSAVPKGTYCST